MPSAITSRPASEPPNEVHPAVMAHAERRFAEDRAAMPASLAGFGVTAEAYARHSPSLSPEEIAVEKLQARCEAKGEPIPARLAESLVRMTDGEIVAPSPAA